MKTSGLKERLGPLMLPQYTKPHEVNEVTKKTFQYPNTIVLDKPIQNLSIPKNKIILWAMTAEGHFIYAPEKPEERDLPIGHPNLVGGAKARVCGELFFDEDKETWIINNASGRYCKYYPNTSSYLENVKAHLEQMVPSLVGILEVAPSLFHGGLSINTEEQFLEHFYKWSAVSSDLQALTVLVQASKAITSVETTLRKKVQEEIDDGLMSSILVFFEAYWNDGKFKPQTNTIQTIIDIYNDNDLSQTLKSLAINTLSVAYNIGESVHTDDSIKILMQDYIDRYEMPQVNEAFIGAQNITLSCRKPPGKYA